MVPQNTARTERLPGLDNHQSSPTPRLDHLGNRDAFDDEDAMDGDMEGWEDEADKLYTWTQNLSMEDIGLMTPS